MTTAVETTSTFEVGIVGAGEQADESRIPAFTSGILRDLGVRVVGLAEPDTQRARNVAARHGIPATHDSLDAMLEAHPSMRAVGIFTPHHTHAPLALAALRAGRHVLVEKPEATSLEDVLRMEREAVDRGLVLATGYQYPTANRAVLRDIANGQLVGVRRRMHLEWRRRDGIPNRPPFWNSATHGGVGLDLASHLVSIAIAAMDPHEPMMVTATGTSDHGTRMYGEGFAAYDTVSATIVFSGSKHVTLETAWAADVDDDVARFTVAGSTGELTVPLMTSELETAAFAPVLRKRGFGDELVREVLQDHLPVPTEESFAWQANDFVRACRQERELVLPSRAACLVQSTLDGIAESAANHGRQVILPSVRI